MTPFKIAMSWTFSFLLALSLISVPVWAEDDAPAEPKPPAAVKPKPPALKQAGPKQAKDKAVVVALVAVKSAEAVEALAKECGIEITADKMTGMIEGFLPFLGQGGLSPNKPIGLVFFGGPKVTVDKAAGFVLPVEPKKVTLESFMDQGAEPFPGHPDTVVLNNMPFRRTEKNLIFGMFPNAVADLDESIIADSVKSAGALARLSVDVGVVRKTMPDQLKAFIDQIKATAAPAKNADEQMGQDFVYDLIADKLNRLELGIDHNEKGLRILTTIAPVSPLTAGSFTRPELPAGTIVRVDMAVKPKQLMPFIDEEFVKKNVDHDQAVKLTEEQRTQITGVMVKAGALLLSSDATTIGVSMAKDQPIVYCVLQNTKAGDFTGDLNKLLADFKRVADGGAIKDAEKFVLSTVTVSGTQVTRVTATEVNGTVGHMDVVQKGSTVFIEASPGTTSHIATLLAAPAGKRKIGAAVEGSLELGTALDIASKQAGDALGGMPADKQAEIVKMFKGTTLEWSAKTVGDGLTFDVTVPPSIIQKIGKVARMQNEAPAGNDPPAEKGPPAAKDGL